MAAAKSNSHLLGNSAWNVIAFLVAVGLNLSILPFVLFRLGANRVRCCRSGDRVHCARIGVSVADRHALFGNALRFFKLRPEKGRGDLVWKK
jgi:hypothetical protein